MRKWYNRLKKMYDSALALLLALTFVCVLFQVACRYVFHIPAPWTEELAKFAMMGLVYFGAVSVLRTGNHLGAFFLRDLTHGRLRGILLVISNLVVLTFLGVMILGAIKMIPVVHNTVASTMSFFHLSTVYICFAIACAMMVIYALKDLVLSVKLLLDGDETHLQESKSSPFAEEDREC